MAERVYFPAMEEQKGFMKYFKILPASVCSLCARIDFDTDIDETLMRRALETGLSRLPFCNMRLHKKGSELLCYFSDEPPKIEPTVDLSNFEPEKVQQYIEKRCKKALPSSPYDTQLYAACPIIQNGGKMSLLFISSHFITDGYSQMYCLTYALKVYGALVSGSELPPPGIDPVPYMEKENTLLNNKEILEKDVRWWSEILKTEPQFTSVNGLGSREFVNGKRYGKGLTLRQILGKNIILQSKIPSELVSRLENASKLQSMSPQVYFMLALRSYLAYYNKTDDVLFSATVTRRGSYEAKHCGLMLANNLPFRSVVAGTETGTEALKKLHNIQFRIYRHTTTDMNVLKGIYRKLHNLSARHTYESVWFSYQPYYNYNEIPLKFHAHPVCFGATSIPLYVYIMPENETGELTAEYFYSVSYVRKENVERMHRFILRFLDEILKDPELTIAQLTERSI